MAYTFKLIKMLNYSKVDETLHLVGGLDQD